MLDNDEKYSNVYRFDKLAGVISMLEGSLSRSPFYPYAKPLSADSILYPDDETPSTWRNRIGYDSLIWKIGKNISAFRLARAKNNKFIELPKQGGLYRPIDYKPPFVVIIEGDSSFGLTPKPQYIFVDTEADLLTARCQFSSLVLPDVMEELGNLKEQSRAILTELNNQRVTKVKRSRPRKRK